MRLAESYGVKRDSFEQYSGAELDPNWMKSIANLAARGWKESGPKAKTRRSATSARRSRILATETGIPSGVPLSIVHMVQKGERLCARIAKKEMVEANLRP